MKHKSMVRLFVTVVVVAALLALVTGGRADSSAARDKAAIEAVLDNQKKAWNAGDVDGFLKGYWRSEKLTFSGDRGVSRGFIAVRNRYQHTYPDQKTMGSLDFSGFEITPLGKDAALVLGNWHLSREKGDVGGVFSLVFQRFPEGWKIIHDHTSVVGVEVDR